jgi:hypothetical protein
LAKKNGSFGFAYEAAFWWGKTKSAIGTMALKFKIICAVVKK